MTYINVRYTPREDSIISVRAWRHHRQIVINMHHYHYHCISWSDHMLLVAQVKLKLKRIVKKTEISATGPVNLEDIKFRKQFHLQLSNC